MAEVTFIHLFIDLTSLNLFIEVQMFWPHYVMFILFLFLDPPMHRCYGTGVCYLLIVNRINHQLRRDAILWFDILKVSVRALPEIWEYKFISKEWATLKNLLITPKDKDSITKKSSVIDWFKCDKIDCEEEYIGESSKTFGEKYKEHLKSPSLIFEHQNNTGHTTSVENFKIIGRKGHNMARAVKETMYIRVNNPTLNRNIGKYNLPHLWDRILHSFQSWK